MDGRLKLIEQQLIGIDSAAFQNLCDIYLGLREQRLLSINRTGSQLGKQKTVAGTPDTFFRMADGSLRYVEYTTVAEGLVGKIIADIDKCLDSAKTGVRIDEVHTIIICFNSRLDVAQETEITKHAVSKNVRIVLIGLDFLALEIYSKYLILAKDILGLPLDTGQLLPIQKFIEEYNNKGGKLSTPLDNIFLNRKEELSEIGNILSVNDLLIISGFPGVGKTKIAIEALDNFLTGNEDYTALVVSKKDQDISEDLRILLQQEKNYILLIDDANRQLLNFRQILGVFREKRIGNIKLIITVRDYALNDVWNECLDFDPQKITLCKFSDEEITQLITSDSFKILHHKYQRKILELADGNARLAVMASRIAMQKQQIFLWDDVSDLYDSYFQTFIKDNDVFGDVTLIKTLGLISFFFTINRSDKAFIEKVLASFDLDYYAFNEAINELEKRELVEVRYNYARISEQVMANYFFYKVFIKDQLLSFKTLLFDFFPHWKKRFSDTIIPANNSFGHENVLSKISTTLDEYLESIYSEEAYVLDFLSIFWAYKRTETLNYFYQKIKKLPEPEHPVYETHYETNAFVWGKNNILNSLADLFQQYSESYIPALELAFEFCRKEPSRLPELIRRIRERLLFSEDDQVKNFQRQTELFRLLIEKFNSGEIHYREAFFALSETFLSHHFDIFGGGRRRSISLHSYVLPTYDTILKFRQDIWTALFESHDKYPEEIFLVIKKFHPGYERPVKEIIEFDLSLLLPFIETKLDPSNFTHIHFIHDFVLMIDRIELPDRGYRSLKAVFNSKEYDYFRKLDWNAFRAKQEYEFKNYEEFKILKEHDVRANFIFKTKDEFILLNAVIQQSLLLDPNHWRIVESLNIIGEENFKHNQELGFQLLENMLEVYPENQSPLYALINEVVTSSHTNADRLWHMLKAWGNKTKIYW